MARRLRFIPEGGKLVEVTCRTIHGRFLLRPSQRLNRLKAYNAKMAGEWVAKQHIELPQTVDLSPLPCLADLGEAEYTDWIAEIVDRFTIESEEADQKIALPISHREKSRRSKRSPAPLFHCSSQTARRELLDAYLWLSTHSGIPV